MDQVKEVKDRIANPQGHKSLKIEDIAIVDEIMDHKLT
jgi:hypothetical protein